jgi:hypothetical protein
MIDTAVVRRTHAAANVLAGVAAALLLAGCTAVPFGARANADGARANADGARANADGARAGVAWKEVARKVEPNRLVAIDETACTVSLERFAVVREGQRVFCNWRPGSAMSGPVP